MSNMVNVLSTKVLSTVATVATVASGVSGLQMHGETEEKLQSRQRPTNPNNWRWEDRFLIATPKSGSVEFKPTTVSKAPFWHVRLQGPKHGDFGSGTLHHLPMKDDKESLVISTVVHNLDENGTADKPRRGDPTNYKFDKETKIIHAKTDYPIATLEMKPNDNTVKVTCGNFTKTPSFDDTVMFDRQYFLEDGKHHHEFDVMFITLPQECKWRAEKDLETRNSDPKRQWTLPLVDPSELEQGREVECITTDAKKAMDGKRGVLDIWTKQQRWPAIKENEFGQFHFGFTVPEGADFERTFAMEAQAAVQDKNIHSFPATKGENLGVNGDLSFPGKNLFYFEHEVGFNGYSGGGYACRYAGDAAGDWFMWSVHQSGVSPKVEEKYENGDIRFSQRHGSTSVLVKRVWDRLSKKGGVHASIVDRIERGLRRHGHLRNNAQPVNFEDWFNDLSEHTDRCARRLEINKIQSDYPKGFWRHFLPDWIAKKYPATKLAKLHTRTTLLYQLYMKPLKAYFSKPLEARLEVRPDRAGGSKEGVRRLNQQLQSLLDTATAFEEQHQIDERIRTLAENGGCDEVPEEKYRVDKACPIRVWM